MGYGNLYNMTRRLNGDIKSFMSIKEFYEARGIKRVCHFTSLENLKGIFREGYIYSTEELLYRKLDFVRNDPSRFDRNLVGISCSITTPNKRLLYRWFNDNWDDCVILCIDPKILSRLCTFFPTNAAVASGSFGGQDLSGLERLFSISNRHPNLSADRPTDIQAEVMVKDRIPLRLILGIYVYSNWTKNQVGGLINEFIPSCPLQVATNKNFFIQTGEDLNFWGNWSG